MLVKTKVGEIDTPELDDVGPRTKFWAEAVQDLARTEELFCVMCAALEEAFKAGVMVGLSQFLGGFTNDEIRMLAQKDSPEPLNSGELEGTEESPQGGGEGALEGGVCQADGAGAGAEGEGA